MSLFQNSVLNKYLKALDNEKVEQAYELFSAHFHNPVIQENIRNSKEEQYQGEFLIDLFVNVLDYIKNPTPDFNLTTELKNIKGSKKTDGAIINGNKALAVIELKGTGTADLSKVETQAFGYKNNQPGCNYVITSNFEKLRFYIDNAVDFEEFNLFQLTKERFEVLWLCLSSEYLLKDIPKKIKNESLTQEENVTRQLYQDYALFRNEIFNSIHTENPQYDKLILFKKTQKLLDRFLFIFFAEDRLLLPPNSIRSILKQWTDLKEKYDEYFPLYERFRKYFGYMNTGHKGHQHEIFAYNGGLFAPDEVLDHIKIDDDLLYKHTLKLSNYDFESEVSVNILGHIFEHSLNDIDEIQAEIQGEVTDKSKSKRKKDGVFYTPKYITKYIVDNTIGKLCEEKKAELDLQEADYEKERKGRKKATLKKLTKKLEDYRSWLLQLTICDPACGSGAFLNQALEFLIAEHGYIDELQAKLFGDAMVMSEVENAILENNIYGVDINGESVEIAKLSLWLRTAQKGRKLTSLNNNIKTGNSLIDDPEVAGEKAFNWQQEFPEVFAKGGFDVVIGNPPYGAEFRQQSTTFLKNHFKTFTLSGESYILFCELGLNILKLKGRLGYIIPDTYLNLEFSANLRSMILRNSKVENIVLLPANVFDTAVVDTTNIILQRQKKIATYYDNTVKINLINKKSNVIEFDKINKEHFVSTKVWFQEGSFLIQSTDTELKLLKKLDANSLRVEAVSHMYSGIKTYEVGKGTPKQTAAIREKKPYTSEIKENQTWKPFYEGKHIERYKLNWDENSWIIYGPWLAAPRIPEQFEGEKILIRKIIGNKLISTYIPTTSYCNTLLFILKLKSDSRYDYLSLLSILNSKLIAWYFRHKFQITDDDTFPQIMIRDIQKFPLPMIFNQKGLTDLTSMILKSNEILITIIKRFVQFLTKTFHLNHLPKKLHSWHELEFGDFIKEVNKAINNANRERRKNEEPELSKLTKKDEFEWMDLFEENKKKALDLQQQIEKTDSEIDRIVYELYGLTEEEVRIVEEAV